MRVETSDATGDSEAEFRDLMSYVAGLKPAPSTQTDELARAIAEAIPGFLVIATTSGRIAFVNRYYPSWRPEDVIGRSVYDFVRPESVDSLRRHVATVLASHRPVAYQNDSVGENGELRHFTSQVGPVIRGGRLVGISIVALDTTEGIRAESGRRDNEMKLRLAVEASGLGIWTWNIATDEITWSPELCRIFGVDKPPVGRDSYFEKHIHPDDRARAGEVVREALETGIYPPIEMRIVRSDHTTRWVSAHGQVLRGLDGRPVSLVGSLMDVTDRREREEQLRVAQKMEAVGQLTAGVAHNFNNMLAVMLLSIRTAQEDATPDQRATLEMAMHSGTRAAEMVRQLMTFAGARRASRHALEAVGEVVGRSVAMCREVFDRRIVLEHLVSGDADALLVDAGDLEQVLMNILLNARDAVLASGRIDPRITIEVTRGDGAPGTEHLMVSVSDNGVGMTADVRERVFEPFFTTKPVGQGTGLGLATAYTIMRDAGGAISCASTPGEGTTFRLELPALRQQAGAQAGMTGDVRPANGRRVLVVEDEAALRALTRTILAQAGFVTATAQTAETALDLARQGRAFDVILVDRSMPGMGGARLLAALRVAQPTARVLYFTGEAITPEEAKDADGLIQKPVLPRDLVEAVTSALVVSPRVAG